jgi:hypothetical protein
MKQTKTCTHGCTAAAPPRPFDITNQEVVPSMNYGLVIICQCLFLNLQSLWLVTRGLVPDISEPILGRALCSWKRDLMV